MMAHMGVPAASDGQNGFVSKTESEHPLKTVGCFKILILCWANYGDVT